MAASAFAFFFGLGKLGFLGPDEPRYAEVAREMFVSGDYISTRLCGCLWFEKPALLYWISAVGYRLFGVSELGARVPTAAAALATVALLYLVLRRVGMRGLAVTASVVLCTSGFFIAYARVATPDMALTATMSAALLSAYLALHELKRRAAFWVASFFFVGLAVLAKGLVGIVLVAMILLCYLALTGKFRSLRWRDLLIGALVFSAVAASWYAPVTIRHGWAFIDEFFIRHHFQRYTSNEFGHPQPLYFFPLVAIAGPTPWMFFLIPAIARLRSLKPRKSQQDSLLALAWLWLVIPILFFSFSESKLPGYILPVAPAMAIVIGAEVERFLRGDTRRPLKLAVWMTAATLASVAVAFMVYASRERADLSGWRSLVFGLSAAVALVSMITLALRKRSGFFVGAAAVVLSLILASVVLLFPVLKEEVSLKTLSLETASALRPGEKIALYLRKEFAPAFYSEGRMLCDPRRGETFNALQPDMLTEALQTEPSLIVFTYPHWLSGLEGDPRFNLEYIGTQGDAVALRVSLKR